MFPTITNYWGVGFITFSILLFIAIGGLAYIMERGDKRWYTHVLARRNGMLVFLYRQKKKNTNVHIANQEGGQKHDYIWKHWNHSSRCRNAL